LSLELELELEGNSQVSKLIYKSKRLVN